MFIVYLKQQQGKELWAIFFYCIYSFISDITLIALKGDPPSSLILSLFTIVEYVFFAAFFTIVIQNRIIKKLIPYISVGFVLFTITFLLSFPQESTNINSVPTTVEAFLLISISIFFFFEQISKPQSFFIYQVSSFWVVIGILIYFSGTFFIFIYAENFTDDELNRYWVVNYALNATKNILFAIAFLLKSNNEQNPTLTNKFPNRFTKRL